MPSASVADDRRRRRRALVLGVGLACGAPAFAAPAPTEALRHHAEAERLSIERVSALYNASILTDGGIERALRRLRVSAARADQPARQLADTHLVIAHLLWRHGDPDGALTAADQALAALPTVDGLLLKGRLLDAKGDAEGAADWYERAIAASDSERERKFVRLRLTMAQASERNVDALARLASERDPAFRNRAAVVLAILGHPDKALALYQATESAGAPFRQHVRLAEWAIAAADWPRARAEAWLAFDAAGPRADALYALAIVVEAHRGEDALGDMLAAIDQRMPQTAFARDLARTRVDLLIETQRYDEAIAFYRTTNDSVDVAAKRRLVQLYEAAGRNDDMVAEYRRLTSAEPATVAWYDSLAGHYMNRAAEPEALAVWATLEARNRNRPDVLLEAGKRMIEMGFVMEAVAMIERRMASAGESAAALLFLFEVHFARGRNAEALAVLERLEATLTPGDGALRDLVDAYERMNKPDRAARLLEDRRAAAGALGYDERMRLAWLYSVADRQEDALAAWRALWLDARSEARRTLAENQLLLLAAELNVLGDLAVELEDKLYLGAADRNEANLLVRIYTEVGDSLSATEIIDEYAARSGNDEIERLRRLGRVYRMVGDHAAYDQALRQLVRVDAKNELEHMRNIVLNLLAHDLAEDSDARFAEIQRWLAKLREFDEQSVSGEFEASILSMGGFNDEAIASYRRALAEQPKNSDNLLLMTDLMKNAGRRDEAVSLLQYAAEHAIDDNAFVAAVDGVINMIGARSFTEQLTPAARDIFRWTHRVILERLAGRDDKFYLYRLLADTAREIGDAEGEFLALENSLSQAGLRRPAVLRELVTLATPNTGFGGFDTGSGDAARHLVHGRRLIGLRQALPPEVYIDLADALLDRGDLAGAERAFDRIDDITGLVNVNQIQADLLREAGHAEAALVHYARALNVNRDDLALLARTAMAYEAQGQDDVANRLYWRALDVVLGTQPVTKPAVRPQSDRSPTAPFDPAPDIGATREYRAYFEHLAQGFLITWPQDAATARERLRPVYALVDAAAAALPQDRLEAGGGGKPALSEFPRLRYAAEFAKRVVERAGGDLAGGDLGAALGTHVDATLAGFQTSDPAPEIEPQTSILRRQLALAERRDDFGLVVRLAKLMGDEATLRERFRARIAAGKVREGLGYARHLLTPGAFERLARAVLPTLGDREAGLLALIGESTDIVLEMEARLGVDLAPPAALPALLTGRAAQARGNSPTGSRARRGFWRYAQTKLDVDAQIDFMARVVATSANRTLDAQLNEMFNDLMAKPLSAAQRGAFRDAAADLLGKLDDTTSERGRLRAMRLFLQAAPHPENRPMLYDLAASWQRRTNLPLDVAPVIKDFHEGSPATSFAALLRLAKADLWPSGFYWGAGQAELDARYAGERERFFKRLRAGEQVDADVAALVYEMEFPAFNAPTREKTALLGDMIAAFPDDPRYRDDLVDALFALKERAAAERALVAFVERDGAMEFPRAALYFHYLGEGRYGAALAVATDGAADLRDPAVVDELARKARAARFQRRGTGVRIFRRVYPKPVGSDYSSWPKAVERGIDRLRELVQAESLALANASRRNAVAAELPTTLRAVWRGATLPSDDSKRLGESSSARLLTTPLAANPVDRFALFNPRARAAGVERLLTEEPGAVDETPLFNAIARSPNSAAELDLYARGLGPQARRDAGKLYRLLATALAAARADERRERELAAALRQDHIGDHGFALWMVLRDNQDAPLPEALHAAFAARFARIEQPSSFELLLAARLHAKGNAVQQAAAHYRAVAALLNHHNPFAETSGAFFPLAEQDVTNCSALLAEIAERLPAAAPELARDVLAVCRPLVAHPLTDAYYAALALKGFGAVMPPAEALAAAAVWLAETPTAIAPLRPHDAPRAIELLRLHARAGDNEAALRTLRAVIGKTATDPRQDEIGRPAGAHALPGLYGLSIDGSALALLVTERERVFPSGPSDAWAGARQWTRVAADALLDWFDQAEDAKQRARIAEALLLIGWQLRQAGATDSARLVVAALAKKAVSQDADPAALRNIALMTLRLGQPLPSTLAEQVVAQGTLAAEQEAALVQALADAGEPETALRVGRLADRGDKIALMRALRPLAEERGDKAYAADLTARLAAADTARRRLGLEPVD